MIKIIAALFVLLLLITACQIGGYEIRKTPTGNKPVDDLVTNGNSSENALLTNCKADFEYYKDISEKKYDGSISILNVEEVSNMESVEEFSSTWGSSLSINLDIEQRRTKLDFPIVLFGIKFKGPGGQIPLVLACGNDGKLMEHSKNLLLVSA